MNIEQARELFNLNRISNIGRNPMDSRSQHGFSECPKPQAITAVKNNATINTAKKQPPPQEESDDEITSVKDIIETEPDIKEVRKYFKQRVMDLPDSDESDDD